MLSPGGKGEEQVLVLVPFPCNLGYTPVLTLGAFATNHTLGGGRGKWGGLRQITHLVCVYKLYILKGGMPVFFRLK